MKVRDTLANPAGVRNVPVKDEKHVSAGGKADFQSHLENVGGNNYEQRLQELVDEIVRQGEKLGRKVDIRELMAYKRLISEFLDLALGRSRKFSKQSLLDRRGRHRIYALVKKIDSDLDQLTQDVMNGEKDNIGILQKLDDIRGLILDMLM